MTKITAILASHPFRYYHSVYNTDEGIELSMGQFHSGSTFDGEIKLSKVDEYELERAIKQGYGPVFSIDLS